MRSKLFFISVLIYFITSCGVRLVPVEDIITRESNGIIVTVGKQNKSFYKDDLYTPVYITIANNTEKKIRIDYKNFIMADDQNNQFVSVPLDKVRNESKETQKRHEKFSCPPSCYPYQIPYIYSETYPFPYTGEYYNTYYPSLHYPYLSSDPYLYYKDKDNNFKEVPPIPYPYIYPASPLPYEYEMNDPQLMALRMEEIYPHFQTQGYIYFHQAAMHAKERVKLLINIPQYTEKPLEFEFIVK